jgi:serine O-acetyltransferase
MKRPPASEWLAETSAAGKSCILDTGAIIDRNMFRAVREQIDTIFRGDPAAKSAVEIFFCYPGFHAILLHRMSHKLHQAGFLLLARMVSQLNRSLTGIEIHPGAQIGRRCFIDHGMGIVIGETAEIGDDVLMYQGVTLGGTGKEKGKRHPTIGNNVVIGTGAIVLGNITIGDHSKVGAGSVVIRSVPEHSTVVGVPGRITRMRGETGALEHGNLPDPEGQLIDDLSRRLEQLEAQVRMLADEKLAEQR